MTTIINEKQSSGLSFDNIKTYGASTGTVVAGMVVAHVALKAIKKQDSLLINGGLVVGGLVGAMQLQNPWLKLLCLGAAGYGTIKCLNIATKEITAPGDTGAAGLSGLLPESIKAKIRGFIPTLGEVTLLGDDDLQGMPSLDDMAGVEDGIAIDVTNQKTIGSTML
jgi:hypothetical protein